MRFKVSAQNYHGHALGHAGVRVLAKDHQMPSHQLLHLFLSALSMVLKKARGPTLAKIVYKISKSFDFTESK